MPVDRIHFDPPIPRNVQEGSAASLTVSFTLAGVAASPATLRYLIEDGNSGETVLNWTSVTAATSVALPLPPSANALLDQSLPRERRYVTVAADYASTANACYAVATYDVVNTPGV